MNFVANIPHIRCFIKKEYVHDLERGHGEYIEAVLIAVKSMRGKALMFEAYLPEYGACFDKFPISALVWRKNIINSEQLNLNQLELWDAFSYHIQIWEKTLLKNCNAFCLNIESFSKALCLAAALAPALASTHTAKFNKCYIVWPMF